MRQDWIQPEFVKYPHQEGEFVPERKATTKRGSRFRVAIAICLFVVGLAVAGDGFIQWSFADFGSGLMGSDAAAEEYRLAQSSRKAAIEHEERKREERIVGEKTRSDGLRRIFIGSILALFGASGFAWNIIQAGKPMQVR